MIRLSPAALLAVALAAAPAAAQERPAPPVVVPVAPPRPELAPPPRPSVITNPRWAIPPRPIYPVRALERGVEGRVRLECVILPNGAVSECAILAESPPDAGFGAEALTAARAARVTPRTVDGVAERARVTFNVDFRLPPDPAPPVPVSPKKPGS